MTIATPLRLSLLGLLVAGSLAAAPRTGTVKGRVTIRKDGAEKDRGGAWVYLKGLPEPSKKRPRPTVIQKNLAFQPPVIVVVKGTEVEFPNRDSRIHNVFSTSDAKEFDLGEYDRGESKPVRFDHEGVVDVYCNIHPDMAMKVKVVENHWFAQTAADGSFTLRGVPPGTYTLVAWLPAGEQEVPKEITVKAGGTVTADLTINEGEPPTRHLRKDGTPYPNRYP